MEWVKVELPSEIADVVGDFRRLSLSGSIKLNFNAGRIENYIETRNRRLPRGLTVPPAGKDNRGERNP